mgnify:CR=1 FL=1
MMTFAATREQRDNLEGLAYWVSDRAWSRERGKLDEYEERRTGDTIRAIFNALDRLAVWETHNPLIFISTLARPVKGALPSPI